MARTARDGLRAVGRTAALAGRAGDRCVDLDLVGHAESRLGEVDVEPQERVLTALRARSRPATRVLAEERVHDVVEVEPLATETAAAVSAQRVAATVVRRALLRVGQHFVGNRDL